MILVTTLTHINLAVDSHQQPKWFVFFIFTERHNICLWCHIVWTCVKYSGWLKMPGMLPAAETVPECWICFSFLKYHYYICFKNYGSRLKNKRAPVLIHTSLWHDLSCSRTVTGRWVKGKAGRGQECKSTLQQPYNKVMQHAGQTTTSQNPCPASMAQLLCGTRENTVESAGSTVIWSDCAKNAVWSEMAAYVCVPRKNSGCIVLVKVVD